MPVTSSKKVLICISLLARLEVLVRPLRLWRAMIGFALRYTEPVRFKSSSRRVGRGGGRLAPYRNCDRSGRRALNGFLNILVPGRVRSSR